VIEKVLRSLPNNFDAMVNVIEESKDLTQLSVDELLGSLLSHESRMNKYDDSLENAFRFQVLVSRGKGGSNSRGGGKRNIRNNKNDSSEQERRPDQNHHSLRGSSNINSYPNQRYEKSKVKCFYCNKLGHFVHQCRKKKDDLTRHYENYYNTTKKYQDLLFLTCNDTQETSNDIWMLDSVCSNHMT
jgi:hypothetical protein